MGVDLLSVFYTRHEGLVWPTNKPADLDEYSYSCCVQTEVVPGHLCCGRQVLGITRHPGRVAEMCIVFACRRVDMCSRSNRVLTKAGEPGHRVRISERDVITLRLPILSCGHLGPDKVMNLPEIGSCLVGEPLLGSLLQIEVHSRISAKGGKEW